MSDNLLKKYLEKNGDTDSFYLNRTPTHTACINDNFILAKLLALYGADFRIIKDSNKKTAVEYLINQNRINKILFIQNQIEASRRILFKNMKEKMLLCDKLKTLEETNRNLNDVKVGHYR